MQRFFQDPEKKSDGEPKDTPAPKKNLDEVPLAPIKPIPELRDLKVSKDSFIIDEESIKMLQQAVVEQRFVYIDYIKDNKIYRHFTPTAIMQLADETEAEKAVREESEKICLASKFTSSQVALGPLPNRGTSGIVHINADFITRKTYSKTIDDEQNYLLTDLRSAGSCKKIHDANIFTFIGRSQFNLSIFELEDFFEVCFYYHEHNNLIRSKDWCFGANIARSEPWFYLSAGMGALEDRLPPVDSKHHAVKRNALASSMVQCQPRSVEYNSAWKKLLALPTEEKIKKAALYMMHTIYVASGLQENPEGSLATVPDAILVKKALETASSYGIPLDVDYIPREVKGNDGATALMQAAKCGKLEIVEYLIAAKANIHATDEKKYTVLEYAVMGGDKDIFNLLISKGADLKKELRLALLVDSAQNPTTQLIFLKQIMTIPSVGLSIFTLTEPDSKNTLLHLAIEKNNIDVIKLALENKADIYIKNAQDLSPLDLILKKGDAALLEIALPYLNSKDLENIKQDPKGAWMLSKIHVHLGQEMEDREKPKNKILKP